jgi:TonB family protein
MGYQALLFCPDEKTARTVTQVLGELEFGVAACTEPFAAVKKLMSDHFDALVVDCDNEQNATLLFKSARNSTSNQTALAVAVVEGQAGVAKAFRFGANLVLTKPINVEQAKGTLRVARGLLRKGDPGKPAAQPAPPAPAATATSAPAAPAKPLAANPPQKPAAAAPRNVAPGAAKPGSSSLPPKPVPANAAPAAKRPAVTNIPAPVQPVVNHPVATASAGDEDLLGIAAEDSSSTTAPLPSAPAAFSVKDSSVSQPSKLTTWIPSATGTPAAETKPVMKATPSPSLGSGAASAPAPALDKSHVAEVAPPPMKEDILETPLESAASASHISEGPTTTFTFGGAAVEQESSGGSKKILLAVAAAVVVAVGGYFGWNFYQSRSSQQAAPVAMSHPAPPAQSVPAPGAAQSTPAATTPAANSVSTTPNSQKPVQPSTDAATPTTTVADDGENSADDAPAPATKKGSAAPASAPKSDASKPAPTPLVVHGGKVASVAAKSAANSGSDAPAPAVIGMAVPGSSAPPLNLVGGSTTAARPVLEKLNISQGVSQGLLIKKVSPVYPRNALSMRVEGRVELLATISKNGDISSVKVVSGDSQLTKAATDAVKQWKYKPYLLNGEPVEIQTQVTINFRLPN